MSVEITNISISQPLSNQCDFSAALLTTFFYNILNGTLNVYSFSLKHEICFQCIFFLLARQEYIKNPASFFCTYTFILLDYLHFSTSTTKTLVIDFYISINMLNHFKKKKDSYMHFRSMNLRFKKLQQWLFKRL